MEGLPPELVSKRDSLVATIAQWKRVAVAFSAGVDSTVVAKAAHSACGDDAVAVIANSPSLASGELDLAKQLAEQIGISLHVIETEEFSQLAYVQNQPDRCFHCKTELYSQILPRLSEFDVDVMLNGANVDDQGDYRPGMQAADDFCVKSPLIEAGFTKHDVRELARFWNLPVWDKPASPCLSSRISYGVEVTPERVRRIDNAERFLKSRFNIAELRVRLAESDVARIEVPIENIPALVAPDHRTEIVNHFREIGFQYVTIDLEGFRSGSLNAVIDVHEIDIKQ